MFENFSKVNYYLNGQTLEVTDIFKSIKLDFSNFLDYTTKKNENGSRPDQFSNEVYGDPKKYWTIFLANDIKNPFKDWTQGQASLEKQNEAEYDSYVFQFANTSKYLPGNTAYYSINSTDSYLGVDLSSIKNDDVIVYSLGNNSDKFTCFGAGQVYSSVVCGAPHYGQALIPTNFKNRNDVTTVSAGGNVSASLDSIGRIWMWGQPIGFTNSQTQISEDGRLYNTVLNSFQKLNTTKNKITGSLDSSWTCIGNGCTSTISYPVNEAQTISKLAFTKDNDFSGLVLLQDGSINSYGGITHTEAHSTYSDIDCSDSYCLGIVADVGASEGKVIEFNYTGINSGLVPTITPKITKIACGKTHTILLDENGNIHTIGTNEKNRLDLPSDRTYTQIGAGEYFSAGIDSDSNLVLTGEILQNSGSCSGSTAYVAISAISGTYDTISCGDNHILCLGSGTSKQYFGRVVNVDTDYKRVFVKGYTAPDLASILYADPSGTNVTIFRNQNLITNIQHQLLSIDSYVNTAQYIIDANNTVINVTDNNGTLWKTEFIINYQNANSLNTYITPYKLKIDKINTNLKLIDLNKIYSLEQSIKEQVSIENKIYIKMSEL
jgi:hypothetical protein